MPSTATPLFSSGIGPDFSVDDAGTICYFQGEAVVCRDPAGNSNWLPFSAASMEVSPSGVLHYALPENLYRWDGNQSTALVTGAATPLGATLTITARVVTDSESSSYAYNAKDELTGVTRTTARNESYAYDPAGNRTNDHRAADYVYNNLNQLISGNGNSYTYDANGNRLTKTNSNGTTRYQYDAENRLTRIDLPQGGYAEYAYDPFGRRIQKRLLSAQGQETIRRYVYDREDILFELDGSNTVLTQFLHGPGIDEPLSLTRNGETYRYHADALGSIIAITDQNNTIVQRYTYDAYGNLTASNPDFRQPYAYTGREYDEESGLYYYRARYYDPQVGKFLMRDPIGLGGGVNLYAYVRNNPLRWTDPTGLFSDALLAELAHLSHSPATALARASPYVGFATAGFFAGYTIGSQINSACGGNCFPDLSPWIYDRINPPPAGDDPRTTVPPPPIEPEEDDEELESCPL